MANEDQLKKLNALYDEGKKFRDLTAKDWPGNTDMLRGDQLAPNRPQHKPPAVLNKLRSISERKIALMTDTKPRFEVTPTGTGSNNAEVANILKETGNAWWDDACIDQVIARGLYYPITMGAMLTQTRWSRIQKDIVLDTLDPRRFIFDPHITSPLELNKAEYCIYEEYPPLNQVKMMYPDMKDKIKAYSKPHSLLATARDIFMRGMGSGGANQMEREREQANAIDRCWLRHFWIKDYTVNELELRGKKVYERKYPGGRYIIVSSGGDDKRGTSGLVIHDEANPYWDGEHPFDMMDWYVDIDTPWGISEISALKYPQTLYNKLAEVIIENAMLMNNAIWVADQNAFDVDGWNQLTNVPGGIIKKRPNTDVHREYPQGVPGTVMQLLQYLEQFLEKEPGIEGLIGKKPGQVQSGLGIDALQQMAAAMVRIKARALESMIQRIGQKFISRVLQFYTDDRILYSVGPDGSFTKYQFVRQQFRDAYTAQALKDAHRDFRFRVQPGSSLSMSKTQKMMVAAQLFEMGAIDDEALLQVVEFPNWQNILKRTRAKQAAGLMPIPGGKTGKKSSVGQKKKVG